MLEVKQMVKGIIPEYHLIEVLSEKANFIMNLKFTNFFKILHK